MAGKRKVSGVGPAAADAGGQVAIQHLRTLNSLLMKETVERRKEIKLLRSQVAEVRQANAELVNLKERIRSMEQKSALMSAESEVAKAELRNLEEEKLELILQSSINETILVERFSKERDDLADKFAREMEEAKSQKEAEMRLLRAEHRANASEACEWTRWLIPFTAIAAIVGNFAYVTR